MKRILHSWQNTILACCLIVGLSVLTSCKEEAAGGGTAELERKVLAAELALDELRDEVEAARSRASDAPASPVAEVGDLEQQVQLLKAENEMLSQELIEFKRTHPLPD